MEEIILEAELRQELGRAKVKELREKEFIPAVIYAGGKKSEALKVSRSALLKLVHQHRVESAVINLAIKDGRQDKARACLIREIQYDPVHGGIIHVDFNEISLTKAIRVNIPVVTIGEAIGVKQEGGSLEHMLWEIEVECLPVSIPKEIAVDIANLKLGEAVHIKDLTVPEGVKILNAQDAIVLSVAQPMKEEAAEAPVEGEEKQEPEVIREKKEVPAEGKEEEGK